MSFDFPGSVLSDTEIENNLKSGKIIIAPFDKKHLTNCAYEITLGRVAAFEPCSKEIVVKGWVSTETKTPTIDISDKDSVFSSFRKVVFSQKDKGITIPPGGFMVCHSHEFIGTNFNVNHQPLTTFLRSRSTLVRAGLSISPSAGWGDVGFANRWGLIIHNHRSDANAFIPFGMKIAQIVFIKVEGQPSQCYSTLSGNYSTVAKRKKEFARLESEWDPNSLIPQTKRQTIDVDETPLE